MGTMNILREEIKVINVGIVHFMEELEKQGVPIVHVEWSPPKEDDEEIENLLESLL
jgi:hypothetical protein